MGWLDFAQEHPATRRRDSGEEELKASVLNNVDTGKMIQERKLQVSSRYAAMQDVVAPHFCSKSDIA